MSSISRAEALLLSHADVFGSYIGLNETDQLLPRIPKIAIRGDALQAARVNQLGGASFISQGDPVNTDPTTYHTAARSFSLRRIAAKVELDGGIAQNVSMVNDVFEQQIQAKQVAIWNTVGQNLITGTNIDPLPSGLETLALEKPAGVIQPAAGAGTLLTLRDLDDMLTFMRPWDGDQPRAFVMNRNMYAFVNQLAHASGFDLAYRPDVMLGRQLLHYCGVPLLVSDWIADGATDTSVFLVFMGAREGEPQFGGLVWFYNEDTGAGIRVDGPHRTSQAVDLLYADLEVNLGFASLSTGAVLQMDQITKYVPNA